MKKVLLFIMIFVVLVTAAVLFFVFSKDSVSNDKAQRDKNGRYLTIINETEQVINEVYVTVDNGTEIESMKKKNVDEDSISIKIPRTYKKYDSFDVFLVDRYGVEYKKEINNVKKKGRFEVVIVKEDCFKNCDNLKIKIDKFFNGD